MENSWEESTHKPRRRWGENTMVKLLVLGILILVLLLPVVRITGLVRERMGRQQQVAAEIASAWGSSQTLLGPVLTVPYRAYREQVTVKEGSDTTVERTRHEDRHQFFALPEEIHWRGTLEPQIRYRGIFQIVVYEARLIAEGTFARPPLEELGIPPENIDWHLASLDLGISDVRGLQREARLQWGARDLEFQPGVQGADSLGGGIHVALEGQPSPGEERVPFSFELVLRGTGDLGFLPAGKETRVELQSSWSDPGFIGSFLPDERQITEQGFSAFWRVPYFGRDYGQQWWDEPVEAHLLHVSTFGVDLVLPADAYQQTERSVKYAVLFIFLTFGTFFLLELLSPVRLHSVQYLLVGAALCLFYLLLLALSEHFGFVPAYVVASLATVSLIASYSRSILASRRWSRAIFLCLGGLYGYLYVLLQLEDYALLLGALGLFAALALVMRLTRHLDWYELSFRQSPTTLEPDPEAG